MPQFAMRQINIPALVIAAVFLCGCAKGVEISPNHRAEGGAFISEEDRTEVAIEIKDAGHIAGSPDSAQNAALTHADEKAMAEEDGKETVGEGSDPIPARDGLSESDDASNRKKGSPEVLEEIKTIRLSVESGNHYGTSIVCWIDGYGLCYDINLPLEQCTLTVETEATQDIDPYETHRLLLQNGTDVYCLAELRFDTTAPRERNIYGVPYELVIMDSDLTDLAPVGADWEKIAPMTKNGETVFDTVHAGQLVSFDADRKTIDLITFQISDIDKEYGIVLQQDSIADEPVRIIIPEDAVLAANGKEYELLISRDRFFALLESGYIGFLPAEDEDLFVGCFIGIENDTLRYLCEISADW